MTMDMMIPGSERIGTFLLVFVRATGLLFATPVLGNRNVPIPVRVFFALLVTLVAFPLAPPAPLAPEDPAFTGAMISEVLLGGFLGFIGTLLFGAAELGGQIAGLQMGVAIANVLSPESELQISVFSSLMTLVALLTFVLCDGHHLFVAALIKSFQSLPPGAFVVDAARTGSLIRMSTGIFTYGLAMAAPVLAVTMFITVALGILSRSMPQIDVFFMGFAVNIGAGVFVFILSIPFVLAVVQKLISLMDTEIMTVLRAAG